MALPVLQPESRDGPTLNFVNDLWVQSRTHKRKMLDKWARYYRLVRNRTWSENRASWLPSPSSSEVFPTFHTLVAWMTDQRPSLTVSPSPDVTAFRNPPQPDELKSYADQLGKVLDSNWVLNSHQQQLEMILWDLFTFGCGIGKSGYDPSLFHGEGDAVMRRVDPWYIFPDPEASSFDDCRYVIEARRVPLFEIIARFPERGHLVKPDGLGRADERPRPDRDGSQVKPMATLSATGVTGEFPGTSSPGMPARWGPPGNRDEDYTECALLLETWTRGSRRMTMPVIVEGERVEDVEYELPYWEMVATAGGVVLNEDTSNPFAHGELPYKRFPMAEIGEFWSVPLAEHLGPAQIALNRLLAALQLNAELVGNPIFLEDTDSGTERTRIINRAGGRLRKNPGREVRWLDPPQVSPVMRELVGFWRDTVDRISGISAVARGADLRRREPQGAVDAVQEASFVRVRAIIRNMEEALRGIGSQLASNVVQFYINPRAVPLVGPLGNEGFLNLGYRPFHYLDTSPEDTQSSYVPLTFDVSIEAGSSLPISRQARASEADFLYQLGVIDDQAVLEAHGWPNSNEVLERARDDRARGMLMPQRGNRGG